MTAFKKRNVFSADSFGPVQKGTGGPSFLRTGVMIPLYVPPQDHAWQVIIDAKRLHPSVPTIAIINPDSGPGTPRSQGPGTPLNIAWTSLINSLRKERIVVLGYVATTYGRKSRKYASLEIDSYSAWYKIDGIFFDEMSNVAGYENYYQFLSDYAMGLRYSMTAGNPGTSTLPSYLRTMAILNIYEAQGYPRGLGNIIRVSGGDTTVSKSKFSMMAWDVPNLPNIRDASNYVGWMYLTDENGLGLWQRLPSYFRDLVSALDDLFASHMDSY